MAGVRDDRVYCLTAACIPDTWHSEGWEGNWCPSKCLNAESVVDGRRRCAGRDGFFKNESSKTLLLLSLKSVSGRELSLRLMWLYTYVSVFSTFIDDGVNTPATVQGRMVLSLYRVIKKSLCTWWLQHTSFLPHYLAQSDCLAADRQGQDTRLALTPSVIPNSDYVIMISDWNCLKYFCMFLYWNHQVHRDFWSPCSTLECIHKRTVYRDQ
jgi:hypothetical protein